MYRIERIDDDNFKIIGKKEFVFTRIVEYAKDLQSIDVKKTQMLIDYLAERGETIDNTKLRITRQEGNKVIVDESNLNAIKKAFEPVIYMQIIDNIVKKQIGISFSELVTELEIEAEEAGNFGKDFLEALINGVKEDTPRE